jgi:hypothetical protein
VDIYCSARYTDIFVRLVGRHLFRKAVCGISCLAGQSADIYFFSGQSADIYCPAAAVNLLETSSQFATWRHEKNIISLKLNKCQID